MSVESYDPGADLKANNQAISSALLESLIAYSESGQLDHLENVLTVDEKRKLAAVMKAPAESWYAAMEDIADDTVENLMRLFTLAEKLPGCEAADKSPVIWLGKVLKRRKIGVSRELAIWIKANTENRYLPHGPL